MMDTSGMISYNRTTDDIAEKQRNSILLESFPSRKEKRFKRKYEG